jgi:hypothetical protein
MGKWWKKKGANWTKNIEIPNESRNRSRISHGSTGHHTLQPSVMSHQTDIQIVQKPKVKHEQIP